MRIYSLGLLSILLAGCPSPKCGDNKTDEEETCDDGNLIDADGCEADCSLPACNNGILDPGEVCLLAPVSFDVDFAPQELVSADFNGDGKPDLATATSSFSISVLLNQGNGQFLRGADIELIGIGLALVTGDFDGDGSPDLAATLPQDDRVEVFRGIGDGSFVPFATLLASSGPESLVTSDFNNDGQLDLATGNAQGASVDLFLGLNGGFGVARTTQTTSGVADLATGDFDGDNDLDLITTHGINEDALRVLLGDGAGNLAVQAPQPAGNTPGNILTEDFNGDGELDLAVSRALVGEIGIFSGDGNNSFPETQTLSVFGTVVSAIGDINGDGILDLAASSGIDQANDAHLAISQGEGVGSFSQTPLLLSLGFSDPRGLVLDDFNGDGVLDAVLTDQANARILAFFSQP
jgi:cysteine-rich repeat protein